MGTLEITVVVLGVAVAGLVVSILIMLRRARYARRQAQARFRGTRRGALRRRITGQITLYILSNLLAMAIGTVVVLAARNSGENLITGVGVSIMAAGVTGLVMTGWILLTEDWRNRITILQQFGIENYFHENTTPIQAEYDRRLATYHKQIDVIGLGLNKFRRDFDDSFPAWAAAGKVRILLLDPDFPTRNESLASQRDIEENDQPGKISWDVQKWLQCALPASDNFALHLYQCLPTVTIVRIDDEIFWSPYLMNHDSSSTPTMLVRRGGLLFEVLSSHFDDIWNNRSRLAPHVSSDHQPPEHAVESNGTVTNTHAN